MIIYSRYVNVIFFYNFLSPLLMKFSLKVVYLIIEDWNRATGEFKRVYSSGRSVDRLVYYYHIQLTGGAFTYNS